MFVQFDIGLCVMLSNVCIEQIKSSRNAFRFKFNQSNKKKVEKINKNV